MEQYSLEKALAESEEVRKKAQEIKNQRGEIGEPESDDYEDANKFRNIGAENENKKSGLRDLRSLTTSKSLEEYGTQFAKLKNPYKEKFIDGLNEEEIEKLQKEWERFDEEEKPKMIKEVEKRYGHNIETIWTMAKLERLKQAGLDGDTLNHVWDDFRNTLGVKNKDNVWENRTAYLGLIALIHSLAEGDFKGKVIVEIGPGQEGLDPLAYFSKKGAVAIGIDDLTSSSNERAKKDGFKLVRGNWDEIVDILGEIKADVIYFHHMSPTPESSSRKMPHLKYDGSDGLNWALFVSQEMDKVLKPGGVIIQQNIATDYELPNAGLKQLNYTIKEFDSMDYLVLDKDRSNGIEQDFIKKYEETRGYAPSIKHLKIFQKPQN